MVATSDRWRRPRTLVELCHLPITDHGPLWSVARTTTTAYLCVVLVMNFVCAQEAKSHVRARPFGLGKRDGLCPSHLFECECVVLFVYCKLLHK